SIISVRSIPKLSSTQVCARSNTETTFAVMAEASFPMMMVWWTINQPMAQIIAMAINTDNTAAKALTRRRRSKNRASGNNEMEMRIENNNGTRTLCVMYMKASKKAAAIRLDAKSSE